jgi:hypothetical protein
VFALVVVIDLRPRADQRGDALDLRDGAASAASVEAPIRRGANTAPTRLMAPRACRRLSASRTAVSSAPTFAASSANGCAQTGKSRCQSLSRENSSGV